MSRTVELIIGVISALASVAMFAAVPWYVRRLPADYFVRREAPGALPVTVLRNVLAISLITVGTALLVLPGQGVLTILIGVSVLELPIKHRALAWLFERPKLNAAIQHLRTKGGVPPFLVPIHGVTRP